jgi:hypothetical protein
MPISHITPHSTPLRRAIWSILTQKPENQRGQAPNSPERANNLIPKAFASFPGVHELQQLVWIHQRSWESFGSGLTFLLSSLGPKVSSPCSLRSKNSWSQPHSLSEPSPRNLFQDLLLPLCLTCVTSWVLGSPCHLPTSTTSQQPQCCLIRRLRK